MPDKLMYYYYMYWLNIEWWECVETVEYAKVEHEKNHRRETRYFLLLVLFSFALQAKVSSNIRYVNTGI